MQEKPGFKCNSAWLWMGFSCADWLQSSEDSVLGQAHEIKWGPQEKRPHDRTWKHIGTHRKMLVEEGVKHRKDQMVSFYAMTNALKHHLCVFDFQKDYKEQTTSITGDAESNLTTHLFKSLTCETQCHLIWMQTSKCKPIWKDLHTQHAIALIGLQSGDKRTLVIQNVKHEHLHTHNHGPFLWLTFLRWIITCWLLLVYSVFRLISYIKTKMTFTECAPIDMEQGRDK